MNRSYINDSKKPEQIRKRRREVRGEVEREVRRVVIVVVVFVVVVVVVVVAFVVVVVVVVFVVVIVVVDSLDESPNRTLSESPGLVSRILFFSLAMAFFSSLASCPVALGQSSSSVVLT